MNQKPIHFWVLVLFAVVFLYKIQLLFRLNFVMDEFVEMYFAKLIHEGFVPFLDFSFDKPLLLSVSLSPLFLLSNDTFHLLWMARFLMWVMSGVLLVCVYLLSKNRFGERTGLLAVVLVLACSTELERSLKIRTDNVSVTLFMISLTFFLVGPRLWWRELLSGVAIGAAPFFTQKAVFFVIAMVAVWIWRRFFAGMSGSRRFPFFGIGLFLPGLIYLGYLTQFSNLHSFIQAIVFGAAETHLGSESDFYPQFKEFYRIVFFRDPFFWLLSLISLGTGLVTTPWSRKETPVLWASFLVTAGFFLLNRPWPFSFVTVIPLLGIMAAWRMELWISNIHSVGKTRAVLAVIVVFFSIGSILRVPKLLASTNTTQKQVIEVAQDILDPDHTYFDGLGMLLNRKRADDSNLIKRKIKELALHPDKLDGLIENLVQNQCTLIIYNYRVQRMPKKFQRFVSEHYLPVDSVILTSGKIVSFDRGGCQDLSLISSGNYKIFSRGEIENFSIDGIPYSVTQHDVPLHSGRHTVCTNEEGKIRIQYIRKGSSRWRESISPGMLFFPYTY